MRNRKKGLKTHPMHGAFGMVIEELNELDVEELLNETLRLVMLIRLGRARTEDVDTLWEILINIQYEVTRRGKRVRVLMN